jgi:hypothetical protein
MVELVATIVKAVGAPNRPIPFVPAHVKRVALDRETEAVVAVD